MAIFWNLLFAWLPTTGMKLMFMGLFTILVIFLVLRLVKLVLDAIPFV